MLKYDITYSLPQHHFIDFTFYIDNNESDTINLHLSSWRPGRYEIGNFAQNIQQVKVYNSNQEPLVFEKITKDCWQIQSQNQKNIIVRYRYYAAVLNAGSSYLDEQQLYINPVNCFMFVEGRTEEEIQIQFIIPSSYYIATQLPKLTKHTLIAPNFDSLADSPLIASDSLKHLQYKVDSTNFHIWFQGKVILDEKRIIEDFVKFTIEQIKVFGDCECSEYHFLMQMLPYPFHHGVEHRNSSVNALGPGEKLMEAALYNDFLGLCSHELFHLWNVKRIRPKAMLPYNFKHENYSNMGYVYEGVTTYYGDLMLLRSGVYSLSQFFLEVNVHLNKHFNNYGRYNQSLADSSVDTWLDGYSQGIPDRKVNIYTEGLLATLILDAHCISQTEAEFCVNDILRMLYTDYYKKGSGYDENIWKTCIEQVTGHRYDWYFKELIHGCGYIEKHLEEALNLLGLKMNFSFVNSLQSDYGIIGIEKDGKIIIQQMAPNSGAYKMGIAPGDIIAEANGIPVFNINELNIILEAANTSVLTLYRNSISLEFTLGVKESYFMNRTLEVDALASDISKRNFARWSGLQISDMI